MAKAVNTIDARRDEELARLRRRIEELEALLARERRPGGPRSLIDLLPVCIAYVDAKRRFRFANATHAEWHGLDSAEIEGRTLWDVLGRKVYAVIKPHVDAVLKGRAQRFDFYAEYEHAEPRYVHVEFFPDIDSGHAAGYYALVSDITERKLSELERLELEKQVIEISNQEQSRLGRDLHDGLGQYLTGISLALNGVRKALGKESSEQASVVAQIEVMLREAIDHTRRVARVLAPLMDDPNGLRNALKGLSLDIGRLSGVECSFDWECGGLAQEGNVAIHLYRIAQEAINNAVRHSEATRIELKCAREADTFCLTVLDNGIGLPAHFESAEGMGTRMMRYRARMIDGTLELGPGRSGGTCVVCRCPVPA